MPDFNDFNKKVNRFSCGNVNKEEIKNRIVHSIDSVINYLFPNAIKQGNLYRVGNMQGEPGQSMAIYRDKGNYHDYATNDKGDIFQLWASCHGLDCKTQFNIILNECSKFLGLDNQKQVSKYKPQKPLNTKKLDKKKKEKIKNSIDEIGPREAEYKYFYENGELAGVVERYFNDKTGIKQFRQYYYPNGKRKKGAIEGLKPVYNLPNITNTDLPVLFVEGEKCADIAIEFNEWHKRKNGTELFVPTCFIGGVNTKFDQIDWSHLKARDIVIWPDNDQAGFEFAERLHEKLLDIGVKSVSQVDIPEELNEKEDIYNAIHKGLNIKEIFDSAEFNKTIGDICLSNNPGQSKQDFQSVDWSDFLTSDIERPDDIISPRVMTPGDLVVFGGMPKVGKTDFIINWMIHMAAGLSFMGMTPREPLKIFCLQSEINFYAMRERIQEASKNIDPDIIKNMGKNLTITPKFEQSLDDTGFEMAVKAINDKFGHDKSGKGGVDVIVVDPLINVFSGDNENDNIQMMHFIRERIRGLVSRTNPEAGILLVHHTRKIKPQDLAEDPFNAFAGAGSLRRTYDAGIIMYKQDEKDLSNANREIRFELRNGPGIQMTATKDNSEWQQITSEEELTKLRADQQKKIIKQTKLRIKKIEQVMRQLAEQEGKLFTESGFAKSAEKHMKLSRNTIHAVIKLMASRGIIQYNIMDYKAASRKRYMVLENIEVLDTDTGELIHVKPTHIKRHTDDVMDEVEDPDVWFYPEFPNDESK